MLRLKTINDGDTDDDDNGEVYVICLMFLMIILLTRQKVCNVIIELCLSVSFYIEKCLILDVLFKIRKYFFIFVISLNFGCLSYPASGPDPHIRPLAPGPPKILN